MIVAEMLERRIRDPRLGFVTVTGARMTRDLQHVTVFYTVLGDDDVRDATAAALASARGLIRSEIGRGTGLRLTPTLDFSLDVVPETADRIEASLRAAREHDAAVAALAAAAEYAGDPDPYRTEEDEEDLEQDEPQEDEGFEGPGSDDGEDPEVLASDGEAFEAAASDGEEPETAASDGEEPEGRAGS